MPLQDIQLSLPATFNPKSLIFDPIQEKKNPDGIPYYTSNIRMRYPDGSEGPVILQLPRCSSWGISNKYGDTPDKLSLGLTLAEGTAVSDEHKRAIKCLNDIVAAAKAFTLTEDVRTKIGKYDLEERDLKNMSLVKTQKDKETKKPRADLPQSMNIKMLLEYKKEDKSKTIISKFYEEGKFTPQGEPVEVNPRDYISNPGFATVLVKIDQWCSSKDISIGAKVYQADMKSNSSGGGFKSLIVRDPKMVAAGIAAAKNPLRGGAASSVGMTDEEVYYPEDDAEDEDDKPAILPPPAVASSVVEEDEEEVAEDDDEGSMQDDEEPPAKRQPTPPPTPVIAPTPAPVVVPAATTKAPARRTGPKK